MTDHVDIPPTGRGTNFFDDDLNLQNLLERRGDDRLLAHARRLSDFGAWVAGPLDEQAEYTDRHAPPRLDPYGPDGRRRGTVILNPRYVECHAEAYRRGAVGLPYAARENEAGAAGGHAVCFTMGYLLSQADISIHCPVTMTGAVAHVLDTLAPQAVRTRHLPRLVAMDGTALSGGTWATELHGGSDVGATTTRARRDDFQLGDDFQPGDGWGAVWRLHGLKWFTSNAGAGLALATARPDGAADGGKGLGCYLVPSHLDDGTPNALTVRRLKEKAGTRGLATAELDLEGAWALEVAAPPDGLKAMMVALEYSRIHNAVGAAGLHRRAVVEALGWAAHRHAFGRPILDTALVRDQILDLMMEQEASLALAFESVFAFDARLAGDGDSAGDWLRLVTALAKYRTAEQAVRACRQAVEIVGGNGYTEEYPTARLYRDCLVTAVWEGPANIQALEVLRLVGGRRDADRRYLGRVGAILAALPPGLGDLPALLEGALEDCRAALDYLRQSPGEGPRHGRRLLDLLADTLAVALLCEEAATDLKLGDRRKLLLARRLAFRVLAHHDPIGPDTDPALAAFDAVARGLPVD